MKRTRVATYIARPGGWLGVGRGDNGQPDLLESVWLLGWWRVSFCKVCLLTRIDELRKAIADATALANRRQRDGQ